MRDFLAPRKDRPKPHQKKNAYPSVGSVLSSLLTSCRRSFPRVDQEGVVSLKYGTPNLCAKSYTTSFPNGSMGRHTRTPFTVFSGNMPAVTGGLGGDSCLLEVGFYYF